MRKKRCVYNGCVSNSQYNHKPHMKGVFFVNFPKPKRQYDKCKKWIDWLAREDYPIERVSGDTYLCSKHFVGGKGPTELFPDPIHEVKGLLSILKPKSSILICEDSAEMQMDSTNDAPVNSTNVAPVNSTNVAPVNSTNVAPVNSTNVAPVNSTNVAPVNSTNVAPVNSTNVAPVNCTNEAPVNSANDALVNSANDALVNSANEAPVDSKYEDNDPPNLRKMVHQFPILLGWSQTLLENNFTVRKIHEGTGLTVIGVTINEKLQASYKINNHAVSDASILAILPESIQTQEELQKTIALMSELRICIGNGEEKYKQIFKTRMQPLGFEDYLGAIHSQRCCLALLKQKTRRCFYCIKQRDSFRITAKRSKNNNQKTLTPYRNLSKDELISQLREKTNSALNLKAKIKRQKIKLERHIKKRGETVDDDKHAFLLNILESNLSQKPHEDGHLKDKRQNSEKPGSSWNKNQNEFSTMFLKSQLAVAKSKPSARRWHPLVVQWCLFMYEKSPGLYKALNDSGILQLPSNSTLRRHSSDFGTKTGFHPEIFTKMKNDIKELQKFEHQKYFCLVLDEIKIQEDLVYRVDTGDICGYTELNDVTERLAQCKLELYKEKPLATHILQLMLRGLTSGYIYPFAYFATASLTAEKLDSIIWEAVRKLELAGFKIICVVGDGAATNRKCFRMNAMSEQDYYKAKNPYSGADDRWIYFLFDSPHLIKTVRNCLANSTENCKYRLMQINGENLTWNKIKELYHKDLNSSGNLRKLHKLTSDHINLQNRMKVRYATQVLSQSVANAMKLEFGESSRELIRFIEIFNKWFDIMNVGHLVDHSRNPNIRPFTSKNDSRLKWLKDVFLVYLEEWEQYVAEKPMKRSEKNKMLLSQETLSGLRQTTNCLLELVPFLLDKGAKFVLTDHFNQDPLEQYFSKQRQACKAGSMPTLYKYSRSAPKLQCLKEGRVKIKIGGGNTV